MAAVLWVGTKPAIVSEGPTGASLKQGGHEETAPHPLQSGQNRGQFTRIVLLISQSSKARIQGAEAQMNGIKCHGGQEGAQRLCFQYPVGTASSFHKLG